MSDEKIAVIKTTKQYYDSYDAHTFYCTVWGGEDLHLGIYRRPEDSIFQGSRRTVERMAFYSRNLQEKGHKVELLDLGSGIGGTARYLAKTFGCRVTALNLSETENQRHREMNREQGVDHLITVLDGNFEDVPYDDQSFDLVWSQDAFLHSPDRERVLAEAVRLLKPLGELIFTDPMQTEDAYEEYLGPILQRIHLKSLATPRFYKKTAGKLGLQEVIFENLQVQLANHYAKVLQETERREEELLNKNVSHDYLGRMKQGLRNWSNGGRYGHLTWGIFCFRKQ